MHIMHTTPLCSIMWYKHSRLQSWISQENTVETQLERKRRHHSPNMCTFTSHHSPGMVDFWGNGPYDYSIT